MSRRAERCSRFCIYCFGGHELSIFKRTSESIVAMEERIRLVMVKLVSILQEALSFLVIAPLYLKFDACMNVTWGHLLEDILYLS